MITWQTAGAHLYAIRIVSKRGANRTEWFEGDCVQDALNRAWREYAGDVTITSVHYAGVSERNHGR